MASITVKFMYNQSHYFEITYYEATASGLVPCLPKLNQGDTVIFEVDESVGGGVEVTFNSGSCFTSPGPFTIGGPTASRCEQTVSASAPKRHYLFTVGPAQDTAHRDTAPRKGRPPHWEAKTGDLEVVTDPPRD